MNRYEHYDDAKLLQHYYQDGNNQYLGELLQRYTMLLLGVCMKYLKNEEKAKDAVQQIFMKVITELPKYRVTYFKSWLYTIARNHCLMHLRDEKGIATELTEQYLGVPAENHSIDELWKKETDLQLLAQALDTLNEAQKICITLFYLQKQSYQQITDSTGFSLLQVKSYIQNGKRNLKIWIEKQQQAS